MATQWGRKETIIWPPHVLIMSYSAIASAILCLALPAWWTLNHSMTPLQQTYITEYARSQIGAQFQHRGEYRFVYLAGGKSKVRLALPVDLTNGTTILPDGKTVPIGLSDLAQAQGYRWFFQGATQKADDAFIHRWLRGAVYKDKGFFALFQTAYIAVGVALAIMLWFAIPKDLKRFKEQKYGRVLRGPTMLPRRNSTNSNPICRGVSLP